MITRGSGFACLMLGLALGCGGNASGFHQGYASQGGRRGGAVDAGYAVDGPENALPAVDDAGADKPIDTQPGSVLDAQGAGDVESDMAGAADAGDAAPTPEIRRACGSSPWITLDQAPNARQLGGVPLVGGGSVACGLIYRGSTLASLSLLGCTQFAGSGIKTVIDIRSESEQTSPPAACVSERARLVSAPMPTPYNVSPADYLADLYTAPSMQRIFAILADRSAYPVYYHCLYGKDRTGVLSAVILSALGASRQTIQTEYALSGEAGFSFYPASLDAVLDEFERLGGVDAYFRAVGIPAEQVQSMRQILKQNPSPI